MKALWAGFNSSAGHMWPPGLSLPTYVLLLLAQTSHGQVIGGRKVNRPRTQSPGQSFRPEGCTLTRVEEAEVAVAATVVAGLLAKLLQSEPPV